MKLHVLGSGSKGNCAIIETERTAIMVDCGLTRKAQRERMQQLGVDESKLAALLVTHEHNDHVKGLGVCLRGMKQEGSLPIYCTRGTRANTAYLRDYENVCAIRRGDGFDIGDIHIDVFDTSHDVAEPVGFRFTQAGVAGAEDAVTTIGYITDSGVLTPMASVVLADCEVLALETNHDLRMLKTGPYPAYIKARIASDTGHLSNEQAAEAFQVLASDRLRCVVGMHISQENNYVDIPTRLLDQQIQRMGLQANVVIAGQNIPKTVE